MKDVVQLILCIAVIVVIGIAFVFGGFYVEKFFKNEDVKIDREIYKNSSTYIDGVENTINNLKAQYEMVDNEPDRQAILSQIKNELSGFDLENFKNQKLRTFSEDVLDGRYDDEVIEDLEDSNEKD